MEARKRQYEYYRRELLTFGEDVEWSSLGKVSLKVSSGGTPTKRVKRYYQDGSIPWLRTQEVFFSEVWKTEEFITEDAVAETSAKWIPKNCLIVAISGASAGRSAINKISLTTNQHCCNLQIDPDRMSYKFAFHWVSSNYQELKSLGRGARSDLNARIIQDFPIPVPPLPDQHRIVELLDKFDALVNDLSSGLPAEIAARRKQYEYYRDKLLTFKELAS
nr:restriction endonuclease subunit S [Corynebacterium ulcerans]